MGYTHYWERPQVLDADTFAKAVADFKRLLPHLEAAGVTLAGPDGTGKAVIGPEAIWFNGPQFCGHPKDHTLSIPWPSANAGGVRSQEQAKDGTWIGGGTIVTRVCDGVKFHTGLYQRCSARVYHPALNPAEQLG